MRIYEEVERDYEKRLREGGDGVKVAKGVMRNDSKAASMRPEEAKGIRFEEDGFGVIGVSWPLNMSEKEEKLCV